MLETDQHPRTNFRFKLSYLRGIRPFKRSLRKAAQKSIVSAETAPVAWTQTSWGRKFMKSTTLALALLCSASIALADVKITTKSMASGQGLTSTTYIKGARQRTEGIGYTTIYQCDLKRMVQINDKTKSYLITPMAGETASKTTGTQTAGARRGGVVTYTTTATDTGERKDVLGLKARRIKSRVVVEASEGACNTMNMEMETDGWYVELPGLQNCQSQAASSLDTGQSDCVDEVRYKTEGVANSGYPVMTTTSIKFKMGEGSPSIPPSSSSQEVTEVSSSTLDQSLFEIPAGYREVKSSQELGSPY